MTWQLVGILLMATAIAFLAGAALGNYTAHRDNRRHLATAWQNGYTNGTTDTLRNQTGTHHTHETNPYGDTHG